MTRYIDETQHPAVGQRLIGIAELDGDAAQFLFCQTIGVHASERMHQHGLAVIDVSGGADDHVAVISFEVMR